MTFLPLLEAFMKLVVFEDDQFSHFLPLVWVRGVFELKCGATSLREKIERAAGVQASALLTRDYLVPCAQRRAGAAVINNLGGCKGDEVLFVNARVCGSHWTPPAKASAQWQGEQLAVWRTRDDVTGISDYAGLAAAARKATREEYSGKWFNYIWDVMLSGPEELTADFKAAGRTGIHGKMHESSVVFGPREQVFIGEGAEIHPFVTIDSRNGPVTLEAGVEVHPYTRIEGPCYVGAKSILLGAKIREGCSIGPMCRIGGEVEESIIHGHSNKYHDGFLGHAYVGEWVNLGALTTNSDLKNDYTTVSVMMGGKTVDTESTKVGSFIGDHVKTSIATLLNTGTIVGTGAVLVATGAPLPKYIPAFAWFLAGVVSKGFGLNALIDTARTAMSRRKVQMTNEDEQLLRRVFELTAEERLEYVRKGRRQLTRGQS
jgi:UDP-N-acetylglucosamine diphosphorylase / glucose-1-phosphate thymidylyltransferase / UDP-N-acetylgalactosamine diphosphorylase / glucosamine-1-phosphate N-acetyltransferase / galactosamine-1-phosphate N-acetyltransferase